MTAHEAARRQPGPPWTLGLGAAAGVAACSPLVGAPIAAVVLCAAPLLWYALAVENGWLRGFFVSALLLPPVAVAWGDSGPHPAAAFAIAGAVGLLFRGIAWERAATPPALALFAYLGAMSLSVGLAQLYSGWTIGANSAIRLGLFGISALAYLSARIGDRTTLRVLVPAALGAAAIGCADYWLQLPAPAGHGPQYVWLESGVVRRAQGFFFESSTLGTFGAFFLVMIAVAFVERRWSRGARIALIPAALIFALSILLSYSRGAILCALAALLVLAVLEGRRWLQPRMIFGGLACLALLLGLFAWVFPEFSESYAARLSFTFENAVSRPDRVLSGRLENWSTLAAFIAAHPWQTAAGIGYKTLAYTEYLGQPLIADNAYLSALVETGIAGLVSLVALNAAIIRSAFRVARRPRAFYGKWIFCFWIGFSLQMLSGDVLTYWRILPVFFWVLGMAMEEVRHADPAG